MPKSKSRQDYVSKYLAVATTECPERAHTQSAVHIFLLRTPSEV